MLVQDTWKQFPSANLRTEHKGCESNSALINLFFATGGKTIDRSRHRCTFKRTKERGGGEVPATKLRFCSLEKTGRRGAASGTSGQSSWSLVDWATPISGTNGKRPRFQRGSTDKKHHDDGNEDDNEFHPPLSPSFSSGEGLAIRRTIRL